MIIVGVVFQCTICEFEFKCVFNVTHSLSLSLEQYFYYCVFCISKSGRTSIICLFTWFLCSLNLMQYTFFTFYFCLMVLMFIFLISCWLVCPVYYILFFVVLWLLEWENVEVMKHFTKLIDWFWMLCNEKENHTNG